MTSLEYDTIIVGAGIVGSAVAAYLSERRPTSKILVVDRSLDKFLGSTGYAPGLVGQLSVSPILTTLAQETVREYEKLAPGALQKIGCLELVSDGDGIAQQVERLKLAKSSGIPAKILDHDQALGLLPTFVRKESFQQALHFPEDGIADPHIIVSAYRNQATSRGVQFFEDDVARIIHDGVTVQGVEIQQTGHRHLASRVILTAGIWSEVLLSSSGLQQRFPIVPVAHPYVFSDFKPRPTSTLPFIRWPSQHVYARNHSTRDGFGTYDHIPIAVSKPPRSASLTWNKDTMDASIASALETCISPKEFPNIQQTSSIFAVTPDNLPLVGRLEVEGLWIAAAVWITTAAGCAGHLVREIVAGDVDDGTRKALDPWRFEAREMEALEREALSKYNDIYDAGVTDWEV